MAAFISVDFQNCFIFIFLCLFSIVCYSIFFKKPKDSRGCNLPPSPPSLPIIGHLHLLLSSLSHKSLQKISSKYGPLLHLRIFNVPIILVSSASVELFVGGTDTSVQTTQWTMAEIINKPDVLVRLREEIDSVVGTSRLIQETDIPNLPYLQAVVKEGLRLHPPFPLLTRKFEERCEIKGFYIPEKTFLVINAYAWMRDPDSWEDPNEFKPERFLGSSRLGQEDERDEAQKYIPFGGGRRGCPGSNLASIFIGTAIGVMVQCFDWGIKGDKVNMEETFEGLTLTMVHPLKCTPVPRTQLSF
ncbi:hypothetical protein ARALYDRAFT_898531 [Arabidopsis lyrata subsp. lyrata]|uniref:Cytochrome P450 n=1 Tax=Arabidopsis lyrata subsp. lyrata TaxID=81972 RepID=D7KZY4_ARALL|nr:hypothetical protein ARALYDRAFT_898531 [Arabidopsis lyrata subsp. lyrata]